MPTTNLTRLLHRGASGEQWIPPYRRLELRETYGDIQSDYEAGIAELEAGFVQNAYALFYNVLGNTIRLRWQEFSGKFTSPLIDPHTLLNKLRSAVLIDKWTMDLLSAGMKWPGEIEFRHADFLLGLCNTFVFDRPAKSVVAVESQSPEASRPFSRFTASEFSAAFAALETPGQRQAEPAAFQDWRPYLI